MRKHGKDWAEISKYVGSKTEQQIKNRFHNFKDNFKSEAAPEVEKYGAWAEDEHARFVEAVRLHGDNYAKLARYVGTKGYH